MNKFTISLILLGISTLLFLFIDWRKAALTATVAVVWDLAMVVESSDLSALLFGLFLYISYRLLRWVFHDAGKGKAA